MVPVNSFVLLAALPFASIASCGSNPAKCPLGPGVQSAEIVNNPPTWPYQKFRSSPFTPPQFRITTNGQPLAPGVLFITPSEQTPIVATSDVASLIMTDAGQLVFNGPIVNATNFRHAVYKGKNILTYWSGISTAGANIGHGYGNVTFLDTSYNEILTVCPKLGLVTPDGTDYPCEADLHESYTTDWNTIIVSAYNTTQTDLTLVGGPKDGWIFDCLFFEIDPETGKILFQWSAIEHVPVTESQQPLAGTGVNKTVPWDYFHINSIVNIGDEYLVNSRHTWTTFLLTSKGDIIWRLQGNTGGDFGPLPENGHFRWQHHARPHHITNTSFTLSYFNNYNSAINNGTNQTTGLELLLPLPPSKNKSPIVLKSLLDPKEPIFADSQGSTQILPNGNTLMAYGQIAILKEYGPSNNKNSSSDVRYTAQFAAPNLVQSYRGFKHEWHATPTTDPDLVVEKSGNNSTCGKGYVSWNGATDVTAWAVYEGPTKNKLSFIGKVGYRGFETMFTVGGKCVQVRAVMGGTEGKRSGVVCI